jgi:hypothetical protein
LVGISVWIYTISLARIAKVIRHVIVSVASFTAGSRAVGNAGFATYMARIAKVYSVILSGNLISCAVFASQIRVKVCVAKTTETSRLVVCNCTGIAPWASNAL